MGCRFCHTGSQKFTRNLTVGEIVGQFMVARDAYGEWPSPTDEVRYLSNIVVMGMGEPLNNLDNVVKALNIITDCEGIGISRRRVTMSTSGIAPRIVEVLQRTGVRLAVSLHAPNNMIRSQIMPINNKFKIEEIMKACAEYQKGDHSRYITFEYLLLKGINDSQDNAEELISLLKKYKLRALFNLIPFNPWPGCEFQPSDKKNCRGLFEYSGKSRIRSTGQSSAGTRYFGCLRSAKIKIARKKKCLKLIIFCKHLQFGGQAGLHGCHRDLGG